LALALTLALALALGSTLYALRSTLYTLSSTLYAQCSMLYAKKRDANKVNISFLRAKDGTQTRDPQLGRLMLYQLSYFRNLIIN
jgi:hypothetical protein